ncbi:hypothetical protein [Aquimarina muelleri]|uniref:Uncharacterized protein n=1 Tax=Aquimarina muelleri TaxID=279356 RepID=A0A918N4L5_9FLAO|nr:hypothetical protein [Aquimarina muelleri]MCX2763688.1 hypothetical protein [Aquimarina muelleri]GGX30345.1 hypothetical protein GCM10007384_34330 [Aquimarina muelleri]
MFTDFYVKNLSTINSSNKVVFFQKTTPSRLFDITSFTSVENCQYNWFHKVRVYWDLSFRLVYASGDITSIYNLKTTYITQRKSFLIFKEGIISVQQSYRNGKQVVDFEQIKGNGFIAVQFYRGNFLVEKQYFIEKHLSSQIDTTISIALHHHKKISKNLEFQKTKTILDIDFTSLKSINITLSGSENRGSKMLIDTLVKW